VETILPWIALLSLILFFLVIDLSIFNRVPHVISPNEAIKTSLCWVLLSLLFNAYIWYSRGSEPALAFLTGYLVEKLLSVDNMFIFMVVFRYFKIEALYQHRILFWGILGSIVLRLLLIVIGIKLIETFEWILYLFGFLLIYSSYKIFQERNKPIKIEANALILWIEKRVPFSADYKGKHFFIRTKGKWLATPPFLALLMIELSDIVFALDSIPAIFAITLDPYIVFTSNIFAILGLRSLYFLLAHMSRQFYYFQHALSVILGFVGIKLLLANHYKIPLLLSLGVIIVTLIVAVLASMRKDKRIKH
jgi:tellurite resistance protein TerC